MSDKTEMKLWQKRILITTWITYSAFYLCRVNMSIALPGIMAEFGYTKLMMGGILSALFITYAIGQFLNGQFGDRLGAKKLITLGVLGSGILNLLFGFSTGLTVMIIIWGANGFFQSMGWGPSVKTIANWFPRRLRGKVGGIMGTSYQIGNVYSWALAGFVTGALGWRWAFFVPAVIFLLVGLHWFIRGKNAPEEVGLPTIEEHENGIKESGHKKDHHIGFKSTFSLIVLNPKIWVVALGLFCLNIVRYGFIDWAPTYMFEVQGAVISTAAYKAMFFPLAGIAGAIFAGYVSDRVFGSRRAPISVIMLVLLGVFAWAYPQIPGSNWIISLVLLMAVGFMTFGPHVSMVGIMAMDFASRKAASSAAGFIDGWGYIGAAITGVLSGFLIDSYGWNTAFDFWVIGAFASAGLMALLWNYKPKIGMYQ